MALADSLCRGLLDLWAFLYMTEAAAPLFLLALLTLFFAGSFSYMAGTYGWRRTHRVLSILWKVSLGYFLAFFALSFMIFLLLPFARW